MGGWLCEGANLASMQLPLPAKCWVKSSSFASGEMLPRYTLVLEGSDLGCRRSVADVSSRGGGQVLGSGSG
jgi:hypothetical protein